MSVRVDTLPDVARPGVGLVLSSTWKVGTPERQRASVEAITEAWRSRPWPDDALLSYSVYTSEDGETLMHYSQWRDQAAYARFVASHRAERNAEIDAAVPGIERVGLQAYELYRSTSLDDATVRPGCVVAVRVEFEGPDARRQREWIDTVLDALASDPTPQPGGISGHFHASLDGTRVLNYAEWESARHHIDALAAPGNGVASATEAWHRVQHYPGLSSSTVTRYTPAVSLSAGDER